MTGLLKKALVIITVLLTTVAEATPVSEPLSRAVMLIEELSSEGMNVTAQIHTLNKALELYRLNRTTEADALVNEALQQLEYLHDQLPQYKLHKLLFLGAQLATFFSIPLLFYYFFPRVYALAWAYVRRDWTVKKVKKRDNRR